MTGPEPDQRQKPARISGPAHVLAAASYSVGGLRRLWKETAFRHEALAFVGALVLLGGLGASLAEFGLLLGLFFLLVAVEALNTAIECIVDHLAPDWQEFARDAKDLGSLAVMCILLAAGVFLGIVCARHLFGV